MISIFNQVKEDMKKGKSQATNFVTHVLSFRHENKLHQGDNKGKPNNEKKKNDMEK